MHTSQRRRTAFPDFGSIKFLEVWPEARPPHTCPHTQRVHACFGIDKFGEVVCVLTAFQVAISSSTFAGIHVCFCLRRDLSLRNVEPERALDVQYAADDAKGSSVRTATLACLGGTSPCRTAFWWPRQNFHTVLAERAQDVCKQIP